MHSFEDKEGKHFLYEDERLLDVIGKEWDEMKNNKKNVQQIKVCYMFLTLKIKSCNK